jgi:PAS domain S-box-containing protein
MYFVEHQPEVSTKTWHILSWFVFISVGTLIVAVVELLDNANERFQKEQRKLNLVLKAASAATWELHPDRNIQWDDNFYRLLGLEPGGQPPSSERFLAMVHPDDRAKMREARDRMDRSEQPAAHDEYRVTRPDGSVVWLENHRVRGKPGEYFFIGITQDITQRKQAEEQIRSLLHELAHRIKNQFAVIAKIASETRQQTETAADFDTLFQSRMTSMSRSHDLLVKGGGHEADLGALLTSQLESFGVAQRVVASGPTLTLSSHATQYLAMAFHELATNAIKHGAFSHARGHVAVTWAVKPGKRETFALEWRETGGARPEDVSGSGFGSKVLCRLTPSALMGEAKIVAGEEGIIWRLEAPLEALRTTANP